MCFLSQEWHALSERKPQSEMTVYCWASWWDSGSGELQLHSSSHSLPLPSFPPFFNIVTAANRPGLAGSPQTEPTFWLALLWAAPSPRRVWRSRGGGVLGGGEVMTLHGEVIPRDIILLGGSQGTWQAVGPSPENRAQNSGSLLFLPELAGARGRACPGIQAAPRAQSRHSPSHAHKGGTLFSPAVPPHARSPQSQLRAAVSRNHLQFDCLR